MTDIFISYSKVDRILVEKLAAALESEGWSVWWDKSLSPGDQYRDKIMQQLAKARAVVAVWTESSVKSDWVRAEAGLAKTQGKLIPIKAHGVAYHEIPLPFGEMHTEPISNNAQILASIASLLARPANEPSRFFQTTAALRHTILTWIGIVGGAISLLSCLREIVPLARIASLLIDAWNQWTFTFWNAILNFIGISLNGAWIPIFNFAVFLTCAFVGTALGIRHAKRLGNVSAWQDQSTSKLSLWTRVLVAGAVILFANYLLHSYSSWATYINVPTNVPGLNYLAAIALPWGVVAWASGASWQAWLTLVLLSVTAWILMVVPLNDLLRSIPETGWDWLEAQRAAEDRPSLSDAAAVRRYYRELEEIESVNIYAFNLLVSSAVIGTLMSSVQQLNRRLMFLLLGLLLLLALNGLALPEFHNWLSSKIAVSDLAPSSIVAT